MKTNLIVSALALAAATIASNANATQTNGSGANFHAYNTSEAADIDYFHSGVFNRVAWPRFVIGSVDHNPSNVGQSIYIDGTHNSVQETSCTAYSFNEVGALIGSHSVSSGSVNGHWETYVTFTPNESTQWAYFTLVCLLPGGNAATLTGAAISP